jgi:hypothetical protein
MAPSKKSPKNFSDYIDRFPKRVQQLLRQMRVTIRRVAPEAEEAISYGIPSFKLGGNLVWFAGYKRHIGFTLVLRRSPRLRMSYRFMKEPKGRYNSRWTGHSHLRWWAGSSSFGSKRTCVRAGKSEP